MEGSGKKLVEAFLDAVTALDAARAAALVGDDYVGSVAPGMLGSGPERVYSGPAGVAEWITALEQRFGRAPSLTCRIRDSDGVFVVLGTIEPSPEGRASTPFSTPGSRESFACLVKIGRGRIRSAQMYRNADDAIAAVGASRRLDDGP